MNSMTEILWRCRQLAIGEIKIPLSFHEFLLRYAICEICARKRNFSVCQFHESLKKNSRSKLEVY